MSINNARSSCIGLLQMQFYLFTFTCPPWSGEDPPYALMMVWIQKIFVFLALKSR